MAVKKPKVDDLGDFDLEDAVEESTGEENEEMVEVDPQDKMEGQINELQEDMEKLTKAITVNQKYIKENHKQINELKENQVVLNNNFKTLLEDLK